MKYYNKIIGAKKILAASAVISIAQIISPNIALGANEDISYTGEMPDDISAVLERIRNYFLGAVIIASVFMILWGAFQYTTSGGDEKKTTSAKKTIYYACIGLVIAMLAVAIVNLAMGAVKG